MRHFIFTNFGIGIKDFTWLSYRLELFSRVCSRSLVNQTVTDFSWVIFVDRNLPYIIRSKVQVIAEECPFSVYLVDVGTYADIQGEISYFISKNSIGTHLITSRIDDDDALAYDAIERIQNAARTSIENGEKNAVIALQTGFEWLPGDNVYRKVRYDTIALGLSLVSSVDDFGYNVNQFAHHIIVETLRKKDPSLGLYLLYQEEPGYLYTKHSLSDSYFAGGRARIIRDVDTVDCLDDVLYKLFGISKDNSFFLRRVFSQSPMGMPYKYLAVSAEINKSVKEIENLAAEGEFELGLNLFKLNWMQTNATKKFIAKDRKIRLAIIGSCVTRDLFTHQQDFDDKFELVAYVARQNLVSYVSTPTTDRNLLSKLHVNGFEDKRAQWDLSKTHWSILESSRPDVILIDFIDERIGSIFHQGSIHSASGPVLKSFERNGIEFVVERPWGDKLSSLRTWAAREFMNRVFSICDSIIIHKAGWASEYIKDGEVLSFMDTEFSTLVNLNNRVLSTLFDGVSASGIPFEVVGGGSLMRGGGEHLWSFCPYHYDNAYYKNLSKEIYWRV